MCVSHVCRIQYAMENLPFNNPVFQYALLVDFICTEIPIGLNKLTSLLL